ncbi:unnamed protein product [Caretta caretta]
MSSCRHDCVVTSSVCRDNISVWIRGKHIGAHGWCVHDEHPAQRRWADFHFSPVQAVCGFNSSCGYKGKTRSADAYLQYAKKYARHQLSLLQCLTKQICHSPEQNHSGPAVIRSECPCFPQNGSSSFRTAVLCARFAHTGTGITCKSEPVTLLAALNSITQHNVCSYRGNWQGKTHGSWTRGDMTKRYTVTGIEKVSD